jgi:peroxiredoxin family protein
MNQYKELFEYLHQTFSIEPTTEEMNEVIRYSMKSLNNAGYEVLLKKKVVRFDLKPYVCKAIKKIFGERIKI